MTICPKCGSEKITFVVQLLVRCPVKYYNAITKTALRSKGVDLLAAEWEGRKGDGIRFACQDCHYSEKD